MLASRDLQGYTSGKIGNQSFFKGKCALYMEEIAQQTKSCNSFKEAAGCGG
jgi:hypothetical protein